MEKTGMPEVCCWQGIVKEWIGRVVRRPCLYLCLDRAAVELDEPGCDLRLAFYLRLATEVEWMSQIDPVNPPESKTFADIAATSLWFEGWAVIVCETMEQAEALFSGVRRQEDGAIAFAEIINADGSWGVNNGRRVR